jgi:integrative and conjugative element protein (TIGR02256 family)
MLEHCRSAAPLETGGILVGHYTPDLAEAQITLATSSSSDSYLSRFRFIRGIRGLKALLDKLWHSDSGHYLGEWHFHPYALPTPSSIDRERMGRISNDPHYSCSRPVLIIVGGDPDGRWSLSVSVYAGERHGLIELKSPFSSHPKEQAADS